VVNAEHRRSNEIDLTTAVLSLPRALSRMAPGSTRYIGPTLALLVVAVALALAPVLYRPWSKQTFGEPEKHGRVLIGPVKLPNCGGGFVQLENHPEGGAVAILRVVGRSSRCMDDAHETLGLFSQVLAQRRPFTVLWDMRGAGFPRINRDMVGFIRDWVGDHVVPWDTYNQGHAIIISNPLLRGFISLTIRIFRPPQPTETMHDEASAFKFLTRCCRQPRSWVKSSYPDKDERNNLLKW
jgi:hypothetical protein